MPKKAAVAQMASPIAAPRATLSAWAMLLLDGALEDLQVDRADGNAEEKTDEKTTQVK